MKKPAVPPKGKGPSIIIAINHPHDPEEEDEMPPPPPVKKQPVKGPRKVSPPNFTSEYRSKGKGKRG